MGWKATKWAANVKAGNAGAKLVLLAMASFADDTGFCWPSDLKLEKVTELSVRSVRDKKRDLETLGLIKTALKRGRGGKILRQEIQLNMNAEPAANATELQGEHHRQSVQQPPADGASHIDNRSNEWSVNIKERGKAPDGSAYSKVSLLKQEFEEWFDLYPHKVAKKLALAAFVSAREKAPMSDLKAGLERYVRDKPERYAWCNPATWLNQERWADKPQHLTSPMYNSGNRPVSKAMVLAHLMQNPCRDLDTHDYDRDH